LLIENEEFESLMISINQKLSQEGVDISSRPMMAAMNAMKFLKISAPLAGVSLESANFPITAMNLSSHVNRWYENLYSDKLKVDFTQAKFPFLIHGDVFEVKVPLFFGETLIVSTKNTMGDGRILNVVDMIYELTESLRLTLTAPDENELQALFVTCLKTSQLMHAIKENDFIDSALKDSFVSCENLMMMPKSPDLSAWHSVQFAEKVLKFFIASKTDKVKRTHKLTDLRNEAEKLGYDPDSRINWEILSSITPSVRYEPGQVDTKKAVDINIESWKVAFNIMHQI
jgi:hypothetical protein